MVGNRHLLLQALHIFSVYLITPNCVSRSVLCLNDKHLPIEDKKIQYISTYASTSCKHLFLSASSNCSDMPANSCDLITAMDCPCFESARVTEVAISFFLLLLSTFVLLNNYPICTTLLTMLNAHNSIFSSKFKYICMKTLSNHWRVTVFRDVQWIAEHYSSRMWVVSKNAHNS